MNEDSKDISKFENAGPFDLYHFEHDDLDKRHVFREIIAQRKKDKLTRPFVKLTDMVDNGTGSADGRVWVSIKGNVHMLLAFPIDFKSDFEDEMFPLIIPIVLKETYNYFAPGEYMCKFPNDIICKKHKKKTSGALIRKIDGFVLIPVAGNLVGCPQNNQLRENSYGACCMKEHSDKIPTPLEFALQFYRITMEMRYKYDSIDKILDLQNTTMNEFESNYKLSINNPNADLKKDGAFWTQDFPNAYLKVDHNGKRYQYFSSYYDNVFYKSKGNPANPKHYHISHQYVDVDE